MISRKAENLARTVLDNFGVQEAPVPIHEIAEAEGAHVVFNHFPGNQSGFALRDHGRWIIGVNSATSERRQRFTIAHELGHLLLHDGKPLITDYAVLVNQRDSRSAMGTDKEEIEANAFAAAILMPQDLVLPVLQREVAKSDSVARDDLIARMARQFHVSHEAMGYRLINLGLISA